MKKLILLILFLGLFLPSHSFAQDKNEPDSFRDFKEKKTKSTPQEHGGTGDWLDRKVVKRTVSNDKLPKAVPLSLSHMAQNAYWVFVGSVKKVEMGVCSFKKNGATIKIPTQVTHLLVFKTLKGNMGFDHYEAPIFKMKQPKFVAFDWKVGDRVLLFLSKPSPLGFTSPLGIHSGYFKINKYTKVRPDGFRLTTYSTKNNMGNMYLWYGKALNGEDSAIKDAISKNIKSLELPTTLKTRGSIIVGENALNQYCSIIQKKCQTGQELPLTLVLALTKYYLDMYSYEQD